MYASFGEGLKTVTQDFKVFSLFSGAGGLDLGFELTGKFHSRFGNEIKFPPAHTYSMNFKAQLVTSQSEISDLPAIFLGSVAGLRFDKFDSFQPDVIIGGPPCQDFSIVRGPQSERGGISVTRGKLYSYYVDALIHLQPRAFVFENVPGLRSANQGRAYGTILEDFEGLKQHQDEITAGIGNHSCAKAQNYRIVFNDVVNASKLGVPQARRRLIIIGLRNGLGLSKTVEEEIKRKVKTIVNGEGCLISRYPLTPLEVFEGKSLPDLQSEYSELMKEYEGVEEEVEADKILELEKRQRNPELVEVRKKLAREVENDLALKWKNEVWAELGFNVIEDYLAINKIKPENSDEVARAFGEHAELLKELGYYGSKVSELKCPNGSNSIPEESESVLERMKRIPPDENHDFVRNTQWEVEGKGMSLIYRRIHPLKPAYTVVAFGGGGTWGYHYKRNRGTITNRERARLQTFPDSFNFAGNRSEVRAQIGEAVPPLMAKRIAQAVAEILEIA